MRADEVVIEAPCDEDWDRMRPEAGGRRRFCDHCERQVHDLSQMSEPAARALLREHAGRVCVAYVRDEAGEIVFAPAPKIVPLDRLARRSLKLASAASFAALLGACTPHGQDTPAVLHLDNAQTTEVAPVTVIPTVTAEPPAPPIVIVEPPIAEEPCDPPTPIHAPGPVVKGRLVRTKGLPLGNFDDPLGGL